MDTTAPVTPLPKVSAHKYPDAGISTDPVPKAARVRIRIKGNPDGPIYQGQRVILPCATCGGAKRA